MTFATILFLFYSFSVALLAIGMFFRSPIITIAGGATFVLIGIATVASGVTEYTPSTNSTIAYTYNDDANTSINTTSITQVSDTSTTNDLMTQGIGLFYVLSGIYGIIYGATLRPVNT